ncbi:pyridoxamine 5'-phosphate oxidase family protein [Flavilitoribacter nigricans]|uniref:Pyridoxamine 5'-phosphate oxidase Alr4036 family FMN-binding domain-containing protein n=1 Tax=Flavilitoribacter nigricans (strain ATCC 23147 / DSM 23189 / NBRC 102662 / NCIMB 1420 / SS-2) TaxID=1122177 RepID=A0A2D0N482_FLAN2|nr:pyridoxamine 5'-phosphate oxidase family protein [Flavilitoribacter nigricans]PHN03198.1 hypothetical protein CRP01_27785 [Flavilitoribacter nigricans DSM 23189 = NBRC 102662]
MDLFESVQLELSRSNADRRHPFRFFYLATFGDYPEVRTVVKRDFSAADWSVSFFTDARSPKVGQMEQNDRVSALFYHPKRQLQLRMKGQAQLITAEDADFGDYLEQARQTSGLKDYRSLLAPGTEIEGEAPEKSDEALHFLAIRVVPVSLDVLQLGKEQHLRRAYRRVGEEWQRTVLVP